MLNLIELLNSGKIKQKRTREVAELLYNKNGRAIIKKASLVEAAFKLRGKLNGGLSIKRIDYSTDYIVEVI